MGEAKPIAPTAFFSELGASRAGPLRKRGAKRRPQRAPRLRVAGRSIRSGPGRPGRPNCDAGRSRLEPKPFYTAWGGVKGLKTFHCQGGQGHFSAIGGCQRCKNLSQPLTRPVQPRAAVPTVGLPIQGCRPATPPAWRPGSSAQACWSAAGERPAASVSTSGPGSAPRL